MHRTRAVRCGTGTRVEETAGRTLIYLPRYDLWGSNLFEAADDDIAETALADLARIDPGTRNDWLEHVSVHRAATIQPVPMVGAPPVQPPRTLVPDRVFAVNNAQLPACVLNNNDCVGLTREAATNLAPRESH